ncbi:hypothetical protein ACFL67_03515 [candidate division KSB1 bacterium]
MKKITIILSLCCLLASNIIATSELMAWAVTYQEFTCDEEGPNQNMMMADGDGDGDGCYGIPLHCPVGQIEEVTFFGENGNCDGWISNKSIECKVKTAEGTVTTTSSPCHDTQQN